MTRRGFTYVELLVVVMIIGILASLAVPAMRQMRLRADAAAVLGDFHTIRAAAYDQFADNSTYPPSGDAGEVPAAFVPSLPRGFPFVSGSVTYRWRRWSLPNGLPGDPAPQTLLAVEVASDDAELMKKIRALYPGPQFGNDQQVTFVIE